MKNASGNSLGFKCSLAAAIALANLSAVNAHAEKALEEVIVTAQKSDDTVLTVPMTVNAVTADTIEKFQLLDFKDVAQVTPGLTIKSVDSRASTIAMRGVNVVTDAAYGVGVAIYWNEVTFDIDSAFKSMYDIGQVEVLRGPQGTLRGVTAPAGAVTFRTRSPNYSEVEGTAEQSFSDNGLSNTQVALGLPLIEDKLALRVAGLYDHGDGPDIENVNTGKNSSSLNKSGRMTLGFRPTDDLEANLIYQHMDSRTSGNVAVRGCASTPAPASYLSGQTGCFGTYDRKSVADFEDVDLGRRQITALKIDWSLGDYDLASVTGYQDISLDNVHEGSDPGNVVSADIPTYQAVGTEIHNFTQEVRLSTSDADFWNWTAGAYYARLVSNTKVGQFINVPQFSAVSEIAIALAGNSEDTGLFTNHRFQWNDDWVSQIGVRYQSHRQTTFLNTHFFPSTFIPESDSVGADNADVNEAITGSASVSYQMTPDLMFYLSYGRSFRGGGFTTAPGTYAGASFNDPALPGVTSLPSLIDYDPETSDSLEYGFKGRLADGRVQVNGDIYYQKYHDYLSRTSEGISAYNPATAATSPYSSNNLNFNADAVVKGAELQVDALLTDHLQGGFGVSYTDAKFTSGSKPCNRRNPDGTTIQPPPSTELVFMCDAAGRLAGEPNWGVTANAEYTQPIGSVEGFLRLLYSFTSGRSDDNFANSTNDTASYGVLNAFLGVREPDTRWEVSLWAKNLLDKKVVTVGGSSGQMAFQPDFGPAIPSGYQGVTTLPRREVGVTGKYNF